jgi:outer membrane protein
MHFRRLLLAGAAVSVILAGPARADDLRDALAAAYAGNPTLLAAREQLRAADAGVPLARADGLPSLNGVASETEFVRQSSTATADVPRLLSVTGALSVPVFNGGGVRNAIKAADTRVVASRNDLRGVEASVFSQTVAAYLDVIRTEATVRLNRAQVQTLTTNLKATTSRFQIGDVTRTDVAQSQSRLALATGNLRSAEAGLVQARETYIQLVGREAGDLSAPPPLPAMPASPEEAVGFALENNPDLAAAHERAKAAGFDTDASRASRLPRVSLFADAGYSDYLGSLSIAGVPKSLIAQSSNTGDFGIRATIPLYQGGRPSAQIKQAQAREGQALDNEIAAERAVIASVRAAFSNYRASGEIITATQTAVEAAELSLRGVKAENSVGNRTVLDILNAEQELVNAQLQLVTARRNAYVAGFSLLSAMGRVGAKELGLEGGALYDPVAHYRAARSELTDWGGDRVQGAGVPTRTVDSKAQTGSIQGQ